MEEKEILTVREMKAKREREICLVQKSDIFWLLYISKSFMKRRGISLLYLYTGAVKRLATLTRSQVFWVVFIQNLWESKISVYTLQRKHLFGSCILQFKGFFRILLPLLCVHLLRNCPFLLIFPQTDNKKKKISFVYNILSSFGLKAMFS